MTVTAFPRCSESKLSPRRNWNITFPNWSPLEEYWIAREARSWHTSLCRGSPWSIRSSINRFRRLSRFEYWIGIICPPFIEYAERALLASPACASIDAQNICHGERRLIYDDTWINESQCQVWYTFAFSLSSWLGAILHSMSGRNAVKSCRTLQRSSMFQDLWECTGLVYFVVYRIPYIVTFGEIRGWSVERER